MANKNYIDDIDLYSTYRILVAEGGYKDLISYHALIKPDSNDWQEEDGEEPDLSDPRLDVKEFDMKFGCVNNNLLGSFFEKLSDGAYHTFNFTEIGKTYKLRLVSEPDRKAIQRLELFSLRFADDFPLEDYTYVAPSSNTVRQTGYSIDDVLLSKYGIMVLEGTEDNLLKMPAVKKNLLRINPDKHGGVYDDKNVTFQSKDVTLNFCLLANNIAEFWRNYNAFLYDLIRIVDKTEDGFTYKSGERIFYSDALGESEFPCYYKNQQVKEFYVSGKVWCQFDLTLVFTSFRIGEIEYLLAAEDGDLMVTEDGIYNIDIY